MELDTEMEYCSSDITNESKSNKQSNSEIIHAYETEEDNDEDDNCIIVDKGGQQLLPANIRLLAGNVCSIDDEPWAVEEVDELNEDNSDNPKIPPQKTVGDKKIEKSSSATSKTFPKDNVKEEKLHLKNNDVEMYINSALGKIYENIFDTENAINTDQLKVEEKSDLTKKLIFNENINDDLDLNETNKIVWNAINIAGPSCSTSLPGPSCSTDLLGQSCSTTLPGPSCSTYLPGPSCSTSLLNTSCSIDLPVPSCSRSLLDISWLTDIPGPSCSTSLSGSSNSKHSPSKLDVELNNLNMDKSKEMENLIDQICNDFFRPMEIPKTITDTNQDYSESPKLFVSNDNAGNFECFQEDPDIVNPEIMYNINLIEHYKYMDLLVEKITNVTSKTTEQTVFNECMQLMPIPQIEHKPQVFTDDERSKFSNGICEWEYKIDRDDWNKIMIKRSVIFLAHAGFDEANEECLYVLSDIITHYVKTLAIIMKKNFDLQSKSSCPDRIDPIDNSLQEFGVKGGLRELIKHYDNDVFGRRKAVTDKCKELQKIVDQFVEGVKNSFHDIAVEKNSTNEEVNTEDSLIDKENKTEAESKSPLEGNADIQKIEPVDD